MRDLAAVSWGPGRMDLFWIGADGALWHRAWTEAGGWQPDESLGGQPASPPTVTAWDVDEMEVFAIFDDGQLWNRYWDGASWHAWESLGGELDPRHRPACSSWGAKRLDVFAVGRDGELWQRWWDGTQWVPWRHVEAAEGPPG